MQRKVKWFQCCLYCHASSYHTEQGPNVITVPLAEMFIPILSSIVGGVVIFEKMELSYKASKVKIKVHLMSNSKLCPLSYNDIFCCQNECHFRAIGIYSPKEVMSASPVHHHLVKDCWSFRKHTERLMAQGLE